MVRKMRRNIGLLFIVVLVGFTGYGCQQEGTTSVGVALPDDARVGGRGIIGGEETGWEEEWRGVVGLGVFGAAMCSGTLIDPEVVLSAGHCVSGGGYFDLAAMPNMLSILGGAKAGRTLARGKKIVKHPSWTGDITAGGTDLSMILLNKKVTEVPHYNLRDFPMPVIGDQAFLVGYGDNGENSSGIQRKGFTTILELPPGLIAIGAGEGGTANTCPGDSGGPVFTMQDGEWRVVGVNSFGAGTVCEPDFNMYSVNTLSACHWLNKTMIEFTGHDLGLEGCSLCDIGPTCGWGRGCGPGMPECAPGTTCVKPDGYSKNDYGYCAAPCCESGEADEERCFDVAGGEEKCDILGANGESYCVVYCEDDSDCPDSTICDNQPFGDTYICIASTETSAIEIDTDSDTECEEPEQNPEPEADAGADTDVDADAGPDVDTDTDAGEDDEAGSAGCGCRVTGSDATTKKTSLFALIAKGMN